MLAKPLQNGWAIRHSLWAPESMPRGCEVINRYAYRQEGFYEYLTELADGEPLEAGRRLFIAGDDLPVEALEKFRRALHWTYAAHGEDVHLEFTVDEYNALRDLLLAIKPIGGNATTGGENERS
jgi:hypothetical protein